MIDAAPVPLVSFAQLPQGWRSFGGVGGAYATSWAYAPGPHGWAAALPQNAIVVQVLFPPGARPCYQPLRRVLPPTAATLLEGTRDTPEFRIGGCVRGHAVQVWVDIGNRRPTAALRRLAQRVVSSIRFG